MYIWENPFKKGHFIIKYVGNFLLLRRTSITTLMILINFGGDNVRLFLYIFM